MTGRLWERGAILATVEEAVASTAAGSGQALFLVGEAGLGKTAVLSHACEIAGSTLDVGLARAEPMEQGVSFALAGQVVRALGGDDLVDPASSVGVPVAEPSAPFHRVLQWLKRRRGRPALIALDDLHWADVDSLRLFIFLARRLGQLGTTMIATMRPWPSDALEAGRRLASTGEVRIERLAPLSADGVASLLADRLGREVPVEVARSAFALSGGTPLLVEQLALALERGERLPDAVPGAALLGDEFFLARFAGLDAEGVACAQAGSVLGTSFRPELACELAGLGEAGSARALEALVVGGLVQEEADGRARFVHPLFAHALYEDLPLAARRRMHARAFRLLAERGLRSEAGEHAIRADLRGDPEAIGLLARTGRDALAAGAVGNAERALERALAFSGEAPPPELLLLHCEALIASGNPKAALTACDALAADPELDWTRRVDALRMKGRALYLTGAADHGEEALREAALLAEEHEPVQAVQPLIDLSLAVWLGDGPGGALPVAAHARALAKEGGARLAERADASWGHIALEAGDPLGLEGTAPLEVELAGPLGDRLFDATELVWPWAPVCQLAMNHNYVDRHADAERIFRRARSAVEAAGAVNASANLAIHIANSAIRSGRLESALEESIHAEQLGDLTPGVLPYAHLVRAEALAWMGRHEESERLCAEAEARGGGQWFTRLWLAHVRGMRLLWEGNGDASDELLAAQEITWAAGIREPCHMHWWGHAIAAHLAVDRVDRATAVLEWLEQCAKPLPCRWPRIAASAGRAQILAHAGDDARAEACFAEALALHGSVDFPLQRVETLLAYGGFLRRKGRRVESRPHLADALEVAERSGAAGLAARAREELRLAGGRRRRRTSLDELTKAEERVAALAAEGLSNAEIARRLYVSVNTVETHLKRVYAKLGIGSRRELIARRAFSKPRAE